ncbi:MAG: DUF58 domain-containing protein [Proteobacteria bacterium]|nr:DUF58 domain-containing protein [Pseudomonadota bacterium]
MSVVAAPAARSREQRLDRRRVYIFPTASGVTFGAMLTVILIGAINYDNALGYLLAFLLFGLVMVAMLHTYRNLNGLVFHGARALPVHAGEDAGFECRFENVSPLPRLALRVGPWPRGLDRQARRFMLRAERGMDIAPLSSDSVTLARLTDRRGWMSLGRLRVESVYPLGILRTWAYFECDSPCLVYPAPRGHLPLPYAPTTASGQSDLHGVGSGEFAGLRRYAPGDPVRAIAWKTLAQEREVMVKRFHGQGAMRLTLSWAAVSSVAGLEPRLSQLCRWVLDAHAAGHSYALELPGVFCAHGRGREHRDACLRALALYEAPA